MKPYYLSALLAGLAWQGLASEFFVEKAGSDGNPGTRMQPFRTIQKAASLMLPGDVCTVSKGLYRETVRPARSGKPGVPIVFQAAPGESVSIGGSDVVTGWQRVAGNVYRIKAGEVSLVLVDGVPALRCLKIPDDSSESAAAWYDDEMGGFAYVRLPRGGTPEAHHIEMQIRDWGLDAGGLGHIEMRGFNLKACAVNLAGSRMCRLNDCHLWWAGERAGLTNLISGVSNAVPPRAAILLGGKDNEIVSSSIIGSSGFGLAMLPGGLNNSVVNCLFRGIDNPAGESPGILAQGTAPLIRKVSVINYAGGAIVCSNVLNARLEYNDLHHSGRGRTNTSVVTLTGDGKGTVLAYNWIHDNGSIGGTGIRMEGPVENYIVRQNVIWGQSASAISLAAPSRFNYIINNTCAANGASIDSEQCGEASIFEETRLMNNIFADPVWPSCGGVPPGRLQWKNNYTGMTPGFVDETNRNFNLTAGSPCIDAGREEPEFTDEFTGKHPDIGAYEFGREPFVPGCHVNESANAVVIPVVKIILETETDSAEIRYTLDGRVPDQTSLVYTGALSVAFGATVRAKAFRGGMEESGASGVQLRRME